MNDRQQPKNKRFFNLNIRGKIVFPYLILTMVVAMIGTYVVTRLVAGSLQERVDNHLLESGRALSDAMVEQEQTHWANARIVAFTTGMTETLRDGDTAALTTIVEPLVGSHEIEDLLVVSISGEEMFHLQQQEDGSFVHIEGMAFAADMQIVQELLAAADPQAPPTRGIVFYPYNQRYYYITAVPVYIDNEMIGVIAVGDSLDTLTTRLAKASISDVIIYISGGQAVASTFVTDQSLDEFSISDETYNTVLDSEGIIDQRAEMTINNRTYLIARGPLRIGDDTIGAFGVALPSDFVVSSGALSRDTYALIFTTAMAGVILIGYFISQRITRPIDRLVQTSRAVAEGDLEQRTDIDSTDEIGVLADTFDEMTSRLAERTRALEELLQTYQEASGRMRAILLSIGDGVLLEDTEGNLIPLNRTADVLLQELSSSFLLGPLRELSASEHEQQATAQFNPWLQDSRRFQVGSKVISAHSAAVQTDDGEHLGNVIVLRDVTAEVEAERLKDAFVAHVSHELRTPLTAIKGYSALLLATTGDVLNEQQHGFLEIINRHTDNLVAMIEELLDFTEMEARGQLKLRPQAISLAQLARQVADEWQAEMDAQSLDFQVDIPAEFPEITADPRRMRWALINLVRNAGQYTPAGGQVTLSLTTEGNWAIVEVRDTGKGIAQENQELVFTRFSRAPFDDVADDEVRGVGLGLYVTKAIVEAHGGDIQLTSTPDAGTTFTVRLPLAPPVTE